MVRCRAGQVLFHSREIDSFKATSNPAYAAHAGVICCLYLFVCLFACCCCCCCCCGFHTVIVTSVGFVPLRMITGVWALFVESRCGWLRRCVLTGCRFFVSGLGRGFCSGSSRGNPYSVLFGMCTIRRWTRVVSVVGRGGLKSLRKQGLLDVQRKLRLLEKQRLLDMQQKQRLLDVQLKQRLLDVQLKQRLLDVQQKQRLLEKQRLLDVQQKQRLLDVQWKQRLFDVQRKPRLLEKQRLLDMQQMQRLLEKQQKTGLLGYAVALSSIVHRPWSSFWSDCVVYNGAGRACLLLPAEGCCVHSRNVVVFCDPCRPVFRVSPPVKQARV